MDHFKTLRAATQGEYKEKGSRFLAYAFPVSSLEEVEEHLAALKKQYYDARHHCYAYRLGPTGAHWRANDDGEPAHTAGTPILNHLKSLELTNVLCVVVRYFGGTKLGASGLIRAYKAAAAAAITSEDIQEVIQTEECCITYDYAQTNAILRLQDQLGLSPDRQVFGERCLLCWQVPLSRIDEVKAAIADFYRANNMSQ